MLLYILIVLPLGSPVYYLASHQIDASSSFLLSVVMMQTAQASQKLLQLHIK